MTKISIILPESIWIKFWTQLNSRVTKSSSKELASRGITVNCIAPGYITTEMTDQLTDNVKEKIINRIPLGYIGNSNNIATTALFLASNEAEYITGQTISVDGGMLIN